MSYFGSVIIKDGSENLVDSQQLAAESDDLDSKQGLVVASALYGRSDSNVRPVVVDSCTHALQQIDTAHAMIHAGKHFFRKSWLELTGSQVLNLYAVTADTLEWAHLLLNFTFKAEAHISVFEDTTVSAPGAPLAVYNRNRNSSNTPSVLLYSTPTITDDGTELASAKTGAGKQIGGEFRSSQEIMLKQNTGYLVRITEDSGSASWLDYLVDFYELISKE